MLKRYLCPSTRLPIRYSQLHYHSTVQSVLMTVALNKPTFTKQTNKKKRDEAKMCSNQQSRTGAVNNFNYSVCEQPLHFS
jgi:hypothetical protein